MKPIAPLITSVILAIAVTGLTSAHAGSYTLDPHHTHARFTIDHFGTSSNTGGFYELTGELNFDQASGTGKIDIVIPTEKLRGTSDAFTQHLKSADLFDVATYPTMQFVSHKFHFKGKGSKRHPTYVDGTLTLLGKTRPVRLKVDKFNCYHNPMFKKQVCGADLSTTIDRTHWGMDYLVDIGMSKKARIDIQIEAVEK